MIVDRFQIYLNNTSKYEVLRTSVIFFDGLLVVVVMMMDDVVVIERDEKHSLAVLALLKGIGYSRFRSATTVQVLVLVSSLSTVAD